MTEEEALARMVLAKQPLSPAARGLVAVWQLGTNGAFAVYQQDGKEYRLATWFGAPAIPLGDMDLPLTHVDDAWKAVNEIAEQWGYLAWKVRCDNLRGIQVRFHGGPSLIMWWDDQGFVSVEEVGE